MEQLKVTLMNRRYPISVLAIAVLGLAIVVYGVLAGLHADVGNYVTFVAPIVTVLLGLAVVSKQVDDVRDTTNQVADQTNGKLDAKLTAVKEELKAHVDSVVKETQNNG